jgi:hypothetical protein
LAAIAATPETDAPFARALDAAARVETADLSPVPDPSGRLPVKALQTAVSDIRRAVDREIGDAPGLARGFDAADRG